jgi:hypothetical protein
MVESWVSTLPGSSRSTRPALLLAQACWVSNKHIRLQSLCRGTEAKPCRQGHPQGILRVQAAHVQHDATEAAGLEQQIRNPQCLFQARPRFASGSGFFDRVRTLILRSMILWLMLLRLRPRFVQRFRAARSEQIADCGRKAPWPPCGDGRHPPAATLALVWAVSLLCEIRALRPAAKAPGGCTAAYPEQPREVHSYGRRRFRMQRVGNIYPGTYLACLGHAGDKCQRQRGASGTFRSNNLADGADRQSAMQKGIDLANACGSKRVGSSGQRSERRRDFFRQGSFYLGSQVLGGRHGGSSPYFRLLRVAGVNRSLWEKSGTDPSSDLKMKTYRPKLGMRVKYVLVARFQQKQHGQVG